MKQVWVCTAIAVTGCSTATNDIAPAVSPVQYSSYDCEHLAAELRRMYTRAGELAHLGGTAAEYARLGAEHRALREAATIKKCATTLASPLQGATPNSPDDQSGTNPAIAPPQVPSSFAPEVST
jgi:hypothetical protein